VAATHRPQAWHWWAVGVYAVWRLWATLLRRPSSDSRPKSASSMRRTSNTLYGQTSDQDGGAARRSPQIRRPLHGGIGSTRRS